MAVVFFFSQCIQYQNFTMLYGMDNCIGHQAGIGDVHQFLCFDAENIHRTMYHGYTLKCLVTDGELLMSLHRMKGNFW